MRTIAFALAALLVGCTSAPPAPTVAATRITYEVNSWGYPQERWSISSTGETTFESQPTPSRLDTPMQSQSFALTPADFEQIRTELAPAERFITRELNCDVQMTDAPYGTVKWQRVDGSVQEVRFYTACRPTADLTLFFDRLGAADERVHALTNMPDHMGRPRP